MNQASTQYLVNPSKFYALVDSVKSLSRAEQQLAEFESRVAPKHEAVRAMSNLLGDACTALGSERRRATITRRQEKEGDNPFTRDYMDTRGNASNFLDVGAHITDLLCRGYENVNSVVEALRPGDFVLSKDKYKEFNKAEDIQRMMFEVHLNQDVLGRTLGALSALDHISENVLSLVTPIQSVLEGYYKHLMNRHSVEGIAIHRDPIITDIAISVFDNADAHGEIEDGKKTDEISAYSLGKAITLASAMKNAELMDLLRSPEQFMRFVVDSLVELLAICSSLRELVLPEINRVKTLMAVRDNRRRTSDDEVLRRISALKDLNPASVVCRDKQALLTREEQFSLNFRNESLAKVVDLLLEPRFSAKEVIQYVLHRRADLHAYFNEENSFYVCKMGAGNAFTGEAPGALSVIPAQRPLSDISDIVGSGFAEVRDFVKTIEDTGRFHSLFLATSPSRTADKANVLLIGPAGCGKSEVLRAVGGDKSSVAVFAQGSDFLTCWKGEAEKNPKRLFEAGLKLSKTSKKRVHFLIDEIDSVLNNDRDMGGGGNNLTLEFQILMDGVVAYPNLSVWGATNNPQRIPTPMMRRFSKVLIVGELTQANRVHLLKHFIADFLPTHGVSEQFWADSAQRLEGAVGDILRKVADHVWREKMSKFVRTNRDTADMLLEQLNEGKAKFELSEFDEKARADFQRKLRPYVQVTTQDIEASVSLHLGNLAIRQEIAVCKRTYENARAMLKDMNYADSEEGDEASGVSAEEEMTALQALAENHAGGAA